MRLTSKLANLFRRLLSAIIGLRGIFSRKKKTKREQTNAYYQELGSSSGRAARMRHKFKSRSKREVPDEQAEGRDNKTALLAIDGNNIAWLNGQNPDSRVLAAVANFLIEHGRDIEVFFDANIGWSLTNGKNDLGPSELAKLVGVPAEKIHKVPSGSKADEWILLFAQENGAIVVSNDRFRDFERIHPFLKDPDRTLKVMLMGSRIRVQGFLQSTSI